MQVNFIPTIHTSSNYDNFSLLPSNREPKHWRKIAESVKERNLLPYVPILVTEKNGKLEIFDGQNRFLAAKSLLLPVHYFIIKDATPTDMIRLNLGQTEWDNHAFLKYYSNTGNENYVRITKALIEMPNLTLSAIMNTIWQSKKRGTSTLETFRNGDFVFGDQALEKCRKVSRMLNAILSKKGGRMLNQNSLVASISSLVGCPEFDFEHMMSQIDKFYDKISDQPDQEHYRRNMQKVYNFKKRGGIVSFEHLARRRND